MNQKVYDRVWDYKKFTELTLLAAKKALENDQLFTSREGWLKSMDPTKDVHLFSSDGRIMDLTIKERELAYPRQAAISGESA